MRQGLNREAVVRAAMDLIEERGPDAFSMTELARRLGVRTASLYNHVESLGELLELVGFAAIDAMVDAEERAIRGLSGEDALFSLADAYRGFAKAHRALYATIMQMQRLPNRVLGQAAGKIIDPIFRVLETFAVPWEEQIHWQRVLRSVMHGFIAQEEAGGFSHFSADRQESYHLAISCVAKGLQAAGKEKEPQ